jgi:putative transposase
MGILTFFACCSTLLNRTSIRHLAIIAQAMLTLSGRVTVKGLSRWTQGSASYRTLQRFYAQTMPWAEITVKFFETHLFNPKEEYIIGGDTTTITKAGKETHGIDRFFSGVLGQVVKGLEFNVFSLISVEERKSYPLAVGQTVRSEAEKAELKEQRERRWQQKQKKRKKKPRGRPKGVGNKVPKEAAYSREMLRIGGFLKRLLGLIRHFVKVKHLCLDGHYGRAEAVRMAQENQLELVSKLRCDAALYEKYAGIYSGRGRLKKYGEKLNYEKMPTEYLIKSKTEGELITLYYQGFLLHRKFKGELNVVVIEKINVKAQKIARVLLFSSDLELSSEKVIEYYSLRFQIEFNFRDAKQHFGLEDFMNTSARGVENAANAVFLMVNLSAELLRERANRCLGINDLKSQFRGAYYALETIKIVEPKAEEYLIEKVKAVISRIASIHRYPVSNSSA